MSTLPSAAAVCSFVTGITEPFEFAFMFVAPVLYVIYALLFGIFSYVVAITGFRAGFAFSGGIADLIFSASMPAAQNTWMILPLGAAAFVIFYLVFRILITKFDLKTPGREEEESAVAARPSADAQAEGQQPSLVAGVDVQAVLDCLGGKENIVSLDNCITRLRLEVKDNEAVQDAGLMAAGAKGVIRPGKNSVQVVIGLKVQSVADALRDMIKE